jgi:hypothetical protein
VANWEERFVWHVSAIPELMLLARSAAVNPLRARRLDRDRVQSSADEAPLPFQVEGADDADLLWALLALYAAEVAERIGGSSPRVLRTDVWSTQEPQGLRSGVGALRAAEIASEVTQWLVERVSVIGALPELDDAEEVLFSTVRAMRLRYGVEDRPEPSRKRVCRICGVRSVVATWADVGGREIVRVICLTCGGSEDADADLLASGEARPA